ncbi:hypothetical protein J7E62_27370 [Variovorax paradoxus]|nr:hypothetical protein [Variovorax paradoxus]
MSEPTTPNERERFEEFFAWRTNTKGVKGREQALLKHENGDYIADHTQRHWWTWQNAVKAHRTEPAAPVAWANPVILGFDDDAANDDPQEWTANVQSHRDDVFSLPLYANPQPSTAAVPEGDARIAELEANDRRYRWLRDRNAVLNSDPLFTAIRVSNADGTFSHNDLISGKEMDAAVDAALALALQVQAQGGEADALALPELESLETGEGEAR